MSHTLGKIIRTLGKIIRLLLGNWNVLTLTKEFKLIEKAKKVLLQNYWSFIYQKVLESYIQMAGTSFSIWVLIQSMSGQASVEIHTSPQLSD